VGAVLEEDELFVHGLLHCMLANATMFSPVLVLG
jgi:hypothetical protein